MSHKTPYTHTHTPPHTPTQTNTHRGRNKVRVRGQKDKGGQPDTQDSSRRAHRRVQREAATGLSADDCCRCWRRGQARTPCPGSARRCQILRRRSPTRPRKRPVGSTNHHLAGRQEAEAIKKVGSSRECRENIWVQAVVVVRVPHLEPRKHEASSCLLPPNLVPRLFFSLKILSQKKYWLSVEVARQARSAAAGSPPIARDGDHQALAQR